MYFLYSMNLIFNYYLDKLHTSKFWSVMIIWKQSRNITIGMFRTQYIGHNNLLNERHINHKLLVIIQCATVFWTVSVSYDRHN